ncbi:peptidoglycan DD-metalloendopeptidase family protein [Methylocella sp.]|jgi:murein DD-endopeptidase MepM/ murein hydrolase activator NlpD|uniref:peptidoglycan DD-metalloendopeptidase family protein n=1 Tax=Methylocella sp. TaxID=1978226 RepID=UPI003C22A36E
MSHIVPIFCSRVAFRLTLIGASAGLLAGCAGSERMADPFSNPFQAAQTDPSPTSSINPSAPVTPVQSRPLSAPVAAAPRPTAAAAPARTAQGPAGWSAVGGTPISVAQGENAEIISRRYGVPTDALLKANGLASAAQVQPGARVVIPVYNAVGAAPAKAAQATVARARTAAEAHAEKIKLLKGGVGAAAATAKAGTPASPAHVASNALAAPVKPAVQVPAITSIPGKTGAAAPPVRSAVLNKEDAAKQAKPESSPAVEKTTPEEDANAADGPKSGGANPEFRWPARGRIIVAFKAGGNDGINISLPEGTSVKAAESGVVAYAGSELKGYGNLILIRHPNGFVSAYANNSDIEVKRGETVKRGQVIAKSGQSGNVNSPQLHFELRKGATPVDPTLYLAGL